MRRPSYWIKAKAFLSKKDKIMKKLIFLITFILFPLNFVNSHTVNQCYCNEECFTKEVSNIKCAGNKVKFKSKGLPW